jgi:hypothetical protein
LLIQEGGWLNYCNGRDGSISRKGLLIQEGEWLNYCNGRDGSISRKGCSFRRGDGSITVMEEMVR